MKMIDYDRNLIEGGHYAPFVYRDGDGTIHIGDGDNHETFTTIKEARAWAMRQRLGGGVLSKARSNAEIDPEYHWHQDAGLQIEALNLLKSRS